MSSAAHTRLQPGAVLATEGGHTVRVRSWRGEGSYARVYQAVYSRTGGPCALKLAKAEIPEAGARLESERGVLTGLSHPRIVALLDWGPHPDTVHAPPFLVLEWLEGETLWDVIAARRRLPLRQTVDILEGVCDALACIHSRGLAHGDIRPQNVLVLPGRGAVLTDPGAEGRPLPADDTRAVGGLLHHMLTGEPPAAGRPGLGSGAGYNRAAVQLWQRTQAEQPPAMADLLAEVRRLRQTL